MLQVRSSVRRLARSKGGALNVGARASAQANTPLQSSVDAPSMICTRRKESRVDRFWKAGRVGRQPAAGRLRESSLPRPAAASSRAARNHAARPTRDWRVARLVPRAARTCSSSCAGSAASSAAGRWSASQMAASSSVGMAAAWRPASV